MAKLILKDDEVRQFFNIEPIEFPKYVSQIINLANQNAQGTRPKVVGQMSDLIQEFPGRTYDEWKSWYLKNYPNTIDIAVSRISDMMEKFISAIEKIDENMIRDWVIDLVLMKTFTGLKFQEVVLKKVADYFDADYSKAAPEEESQGIDGYIGGEAVSIKPDTYKTKSALLEKLPDKIIFYSKSKNGISLDFDFII